MLRWLKKLFGGEQAASATPNLSVLVKAHEVGLNPTQDAKIERHKQRMARLKAAMENATGDRLTALTDEYERRKAELFILGVKGD